VVEAEVTPVAESNNRIVARISTTASFNIPSHHPLGYFYGKWWKVYAEGEALSST